MAVKISYFNITSALFLVLLLLLDRPHLCHTLKEDSRCGILDTDLPNNSVNVGEGVGFKFTKNSCGGTSGCKKSSVISSLSCCCRRTLEVDSLIGAKMAVKISYFNITSALFLVLLMLLDRPHLCHTLKEDSRCGILDADLPNNSVNVGEGVGFKFTKNSCGCSSRRSPICPKRRMSPLAAAGSTVALHGSIRAVFVYLCLKHIKSIQLPLNVMASIFNLSAMENFDEYDIMSRRRIRSRGNHQPKAC